MDLHDRAATARARAGGATKTVVAGHDLAIFERIGVNVPQKNRLPIVPLHPELLIEIAVINFTSPSDTNRVAAHETFDSRWIECLDQKLYVLIESIAVSEISGEPADRKIRKRVKSVECNSEMLLHLPFVNGLKLTLRRRQKRAHRIVNEIQRQCWIDPVTYRVQKVQRRDAAFEYAVSALRIHICRRVTRHGRNDFDLSLREKSREAFVAVFEQNREVATIDHMTWRPQFFHALDEITKIGNHFRRATGEINGANVRLRQPIDDPINCLARHDFLALRSGVHMTMHADQIAKLTNVDLKNLGTRAAKREMTFGNCLGESIHHKSGETSAIATAEKFISFYARWSKSGCIDESCSLLGDSDGFAVPVQSLDLFGGGGDWRFNGCRWLSMRA